MSNTNHPHLFISTSELRTNSVPDESGSQASFRSSTGYFNFNPLYNLKKENCFSIRSNSLSK